MKGEWKMKMGVIGTGIVGRSHAAWLAGLGHDVVIGTNDVKKTLAKKGKDSMGNPPLSEWLKSNPDVKLATFPDAARHGEIVFEALKGEIALSVLKGLGNLLDGKILVDIANPLDFSRGMPPTLTVCNTDSLAEQIQGSMPKAKVVKAFNTMTASLQVNPGQLAGGDHHLFLSGNDPSAKKEVADIARSYGWKEIIDLGDITTARGTEMMMPFWLRLWSALGTPMMNYKIVK